MEIPKKLYKYESLNIQSLINLKSQIIYFSSPKNFNDPYDCSTNAIVTPPDDSDVELFRIQYLERSELPEETKEGLSKLSTEELKIWLQGAGEKMINDVLRRQINGKGISCFSEKNSDLLLWSHYGEKNKGFCLEFDTKFEPFSKAMKVKYSNDLPKVSITDAIVHKNFREIFEVYSLKAKAWEYEAEWRCLHNEAGTKFQYEIDALTGVYFGSNVEEEVIEIICLILQGQNKNVKFWRAIKSETEFSLKFINFEYTPHIKINEK